VASEVSAGVIGELLKYFVSDALGLTIEARIENACDLPPGCLRMPLDPQIKPRLRVGWRTDQGPIGVCAEYDHELKLRKGVHVLLIEWWIATREHHEGWWHCYPNRPREWIKGRAV
jgi:hypothetical protein